MEAVSKSTALPVAVGLNDPLISLSHLPVWLGGILSL